MHETRHFVKNLVSEKEFKTEKIYEMWVGYKTKMETIRK